MKPAEFLFGFVAPAFGASAILFFYFLQPYFRNARFGTFCLYMGQVSYSIYLFHLVAIISLKPQIAFLSMPLQLALYLLCILSFSTVFYRYFEKPILESRPRYGTSPSNVALEAPLVAEAE